MKSKLGIAVTLWGWLFSAVWIGSRYFEHKGNPATLEIYDVYVLIILIPFVYTFLGYLVHEREKNFMSLRKSEERYKTITKSLQLFKKTFETMQVGVTITDLQRVILYTNPADAEMHGYTVEELIGKDVRLLAPSEMWRPTTRLNIESMGRWRRESLNRRKDGSTFPVMLMSDVVRDEDGRAMGLITTCEDITPRKEFEEKIVYLAHYDTLTELPNRYMFQDRLTQAIVSALRHKRMAAILFIDLDHFKRINDTFGHDIGDMVLRSAAERLFKCIRQSDTVARVVIDPSENIVARFGGDEFTMLLSEITVAQDAAKVARRVLDLLSQPFGIGEHELFINASIGISVCPLDGGDADTLLRKADMAMFYTKETGRNNFHFYSESMRIATSEKYALEGKLRRALDRGEFKLLYQPQVDIRTGKVTGFEAVIRWVQQDSQVVLPETFIPVAEETGLIVPIGEWVLRTACVQNKAWQTAGFEPVTVTVNISGIQFRQAAFVEIVDGILRDVNLAPRYLQLELTETTIMQRTEETLTKLNELRAMGVRLSVDDFGTGYSSLNYLKRFPLSTLKIDKTFVKDVDCDSRNAAITKAIITLGQGLDLGIIAEGVETGEQVAFLREHGCDGAQGFWIGMPLDAAEAEELLKKGGVIHSF